MDRTFFFKSALLPDGWARNVRVHVRGGFIDQLQSDQAPGEHDIRTAVVVPGLPNLHSHSFQRGMAGLAESLGPQSSDDFWSWREVMYKFLSRLEADDVEAIAAYAYADMLEAGFTSVGEFHYLHRDPRGTLYENPAELGLRHHVAAERTGIGLALLPVFYEASQFGGRPPTTGQQRFITDLDKFFEIVDRLISALGNNRNRCVGMAPHSLRAVTFNHLVTLAQQHKTGPIHIHAAEQRKEIEDCLAYCHARPVQWLLDNADVGDRWCIVHATHLNPEETVALAKSGAVAGLCPVTEASLGDGIFPAEAYVRAGGHWGIGTDSHIALDAAGELRQLEYSQRLKVMRRNVLASVARRSTGRNLYDLAVRAGTQALGLPVGAIASGHRADFVALDEQHPDMEGRSEDTVLDTWIFNVGRSLVRDVIVGGEIAVQGGRHRLREHIDACYRRTIKRVLQT